MFVMLMTQLKLGQASCWGEGGCLGLEEEKHYALLNGILECVQLLDAISTV
jgi:hypothetical protein